MKGEENIMSLLRDQVSPDCLRKLTITKEVDEGLIRHLATRARSILGQVTAGTFDVGQNTPMLDKPQENSNPLRHLEFSKCSHIYPEHLRNQHDN